MRAPVHVLFIIDQLCEMGGAERTLLSTIRLLPKERFRCSLVTFKIDPNLRIFTDMPCPFFVFPLSRTYDWLAFRTAMQLRAFIRKEGVRIVQTCHETSDLWAGLITRMKDGPALISSRRDMGILRAPKHSLGYRVMNPHFDLVLTVSDEVRKFCIQKDHLREGKVTTLYNGIDLETITSMSKCAEGSAPCRFSSLGPIVATVGHIRPVKGIDVLVDVAERVAREFPNVLFLVVGRKSDPKHAREIEGKIVRLGIQQNVRLFGEAENIFDILKGCDVFFLPSRSEGFSNALIEAMACGLPCVATNTGGNPEAVEEGRSGYLVENENPDDAAEKIITLLRSPASSKEMGQLGRRIVEERFTTKVMIDRLASLYDQVLEARGR
jgi:glycosyltransferase involved in cell wall biosynthesis